MILTFRMLSESEKLRYIELANALIKRTAWSSTYRAYQHWLRPPSKFKEAMLRHGGIGSLATYILVKTARSGIDLLQNQEGKDQELIRFFGELEHKHKFTEIDTESFPRFPQHFRDYITCRGLFCCTSSSNESGEQQSSGDSLLN